MIPLKPPRHHPRPAGAFFEQAVASYVWVKHGLTVNSATLALHIVCTQSLERRLNDAYNQGKLADVAVPARD